MRITRETLRILQNIHRYFQRSSQVDPNYYVEGAYPQRCMVEQPRNQVSEKHFLKIPWAFHILGNQERTMFLCQHFHWRSLVEESRISGRYETSQSIGGHRFPNFEMFDVDYVRFTKTILNSYFWKKVSLEEGMPKCVDRSTLHAHTPTRLTLWVSHFTHVHIV